MESLVWPSYQGLLLIVKNPPNFTDAAQYREFKKVVEDFETAPRSIGSDTTQVLIAILNCVFIRRKKNVF